jgi:tol-pal system beta propeller repeat protein TolB
MLKKLILILFILFTPFTIKPTEQNIEQEPLSFAVESPVQQYGKIKCHLLLLGKNDQLTKIGKIVKFDLEFTDQLDIDLKSTKSKLSSKIMSKLFDQGSSLCLYLNNTDKTKIQATLKDTNSDEPLFEKEFECTKGNEIFDAHKISDELFPVLTGEKGPYLTSLAYCKALKPKHKVICVSDYACKRERVVVPTKTINIAPSWHTQAPILFYSQFTKNNNRLMSVNLETQSNQIVCSYDGLNMQPSFSPDGTKAVLCLSGGRNSEIYMYDHALCKKKKKRVFVPLTKNGGNNASPCLLPNGNIIFCSDFENGSPQIYYMERKSKQTYRLTNGRGYCAAPSYCAKLNNIVYNRAVKGVFQIFTLNLDDFNNIQEKQLSFGPGDKFEPSYSECGRFIAFSFDCINNTKHKVHQITVLNCNSGKIRILTGGKEPKSFPRWGKEAVI